MTNIHNTLNEAAAAATATFRDLTSKLLKTLRNRPQKEYGFGGLFINTRNRKGWAREDLSGMREAMRHWMRTADRWQQKQRKTKGNKRKNYWCDNYKGGHGGITYVD